MNRNAPKRWPVAAAIMVAVSLPATSAGQALRLPGHNLAPEARPHRRAGGESFPPLPLPATPLRRTERKRQPAPPALVAKLAYAPVHYEVKGGRRVARREWLNITDDIRNLLRWSQKTLKVPAYRHLETGWGQFGFDPQEIPVLYITGHEPLPPLTDEQVTRLRRFVLDGGTIIANACCGDKRFTGSFRREIARVFPRRELAPLPLDHPVWWSHFKIDRVNYRKGLSKSLVSVPYLEGINIGCRTAVFFAPIDLANGWYGQMPPKWPEGSWIVGQDARKIGDNLITYILANYQLGRFLATEKVLYQQARPTRDEFVIAQVVHSGDWDPNPSALPNLLRFVQDNSTLQVQFKREVVDLSDIDVFKHPVLYMVGHRDFKLSSEQVQRLRTYLEAGGVLIAEACCGRKAFDEAFRREIKGVLPDEPLRPLPADHPLYNALFEIKEVAYTPLVQQESPGLRRPTLEGITHNGQLCVIYSRYALGNGWEQFPHPYSKGYSEPDALRLAANILVYAMTH